ncbi:single-stranded DNA-binding protein [Curtobacterium sp. MCBD17_030]|uniref:single-stranded DNA-binding protein n=1 Tax=Curtobacterium sp. MCBD17_030 TaxID=2175649 RepID=UPI000D8ED512|nr:single-stranded DNA-binding protein [Curtobacterium sp. MCBD17_030]PYY32370.1 hypothetical protein DEI89_13135 [Curtobacterium sp. MCBD17_030]
MSKATITVEGFVTKDPEMRQAGGKNVVAVDIAHTPRKKEGDQWVDAGDTIWFQASFWERDAQPVMDAVRKGTLVTVSGNVEVNAYLKNSGEPSASIRIKGATLGIIPREAQAGRQSTNGTASAAWDAPVKNGPETGGQQNWASGTSTFNDETPW